MSILVVEKDNVSAELIYEIFTKEIKNLFFVCDCIQASIAFRKYKPSIVIVDLDISITDVLNLIQSIKNENPNIKIIAINSNSNNEMLKKYLNEKHIDALINKKSIYEKLHVIYKNLILLKDKS